MKKYILIISLILLTVIIIVAAFCVDNNVINTDKQQQPSNITSEQNTDVNNQPNATPHIHVFGEWKIIRKASCNREGKQERKCNQCDEIETSVIPKSTNHNVVIDKAVPATCTETGLTEGKHCSACLETIVEQDVVQMIEHVEVIDEAVPATCSKTGLTEGSHCSECFEIIVEQEIVEKISHVEVIDQAIPATCTKTGLTEGKHCSVCNAITLVQTIVKFKPHTEVVDAAVAATCSEIGLTEGKHCSVCNTITIAQQSIEKLPHTEVIDAGIAPTCTKTGLTEGKHCSVCDEVITVQNVIDALPHNSEKTYTKSTCTTPASVFEKCVDCGFENTIILEPIEANINISGVGSIVSTSGSYTYHNYTVVARGGYGIYKYVFELFRYANSSSPIDIFESTEPSIQLKNANNYYLRITITDEFGDSATYTTYVGSGTSTKQPANNHTIVIDARLEATCVATGLTEGSHCSTCNEILVAQQTISTKSHSNSSWIVDTDSTCTQEGSKHKECTVCGTVTTTTTISKKAHENGEWIVDKEATCTEKGSRHQICSVCSDTINTEAIEKGAHSYVAEHDLTYLNTYGFDKNICSICKYIAYIDKEREELELANLILSTDGTIVQSCSNIDTAELLVIPDTVTAFEDDGLFVYCDSLKYVLFGSNSIKLELQGAPIKHMYIPAHVTVELPYCKKLETIIWADGITKIDAYGIYSGCVGRTMSGSSVKNIVIPLSVTTIKSGVFSNTSNLSVVYYMGTAEDWSYITIEADDTSCLLNATRYYYSEKYPTESGNYWRYVDGVPTVWDTENHVHSEGIDVFVEPTCITEGFAGKQCPVCGEILSIDTTVDALGHTEVIDKALAPTCTTTGLTEGKHCSLCNEVFVSQILIDAKGHTKVIDEAIAATCTATGLTEGAHCSVCNEVFVTQTTIIPKGHAEGEWKIKDGETKIQLLCSVCDAILKEKEYNYKYSEGLEFSLNEDNKSYSVAGIGNCTDDNIVIPSVYSGFIVTGIKDKAFYECTSLISVKIPDSVTSIGREAFFGCDSLENIIMSDSITDVGAVAFWDCNALTYNEYENAYYLGSESNPYIVLVKAKNTDITYCNIHEKTKLIYHSAFSRCASLAEVTIPYGVTNIGEDAFSVCRSLKNVVIPDSVVYIGDNAFEDCTSLICVSIGNGLTSISPYAFAECSSLINIKFAYNCKLTSIGEYAFYRCGSLTTIIIPDSVLCIGNSAFSYCSSSTTIMISKSVTDIGEHAFANCKMLSTIVIPNNVLTIGRFAFCDCESLTIYCEVPSKPNGWNDDWNLCWVSGYNGSYCPVVWGYKEKVESDFTHSEGLEFSLNDDGVSYSVVGVGTCKDTQIVIPSTYNGLLVTNIGEKAFSSCSSLISIVIPDSVKSIGNWAFEFCDSLENVMLPSNMSSIGGGAFMYCESMKSIIIPYGISDIAASVFNGCRSLQSITLPSTVKNIAGHAISFCKSLTRITYEGTSEQWEAVTKNTYWDSEAGSYTIYYTVKTIS